MRLPTKMRSSTSSTRKRNILTHVFLFLVELEIANQDEVINKLNKEKKHMSENVSKAQEDLQASEDKVDHLNKIKSKLESTLDELNDSLSREKRARGDIEKQRRKVEGDLKVTQESVSDLERTKKD